MELDELAERLVPFVRAQLGDAEAAVANIQKTSGHAGFSYFFDVLAGGGRRSYFLRLPPPGVKLEGTADVLRQVCVLNALAGTDVPHATVTWSGDDLRWFGSPYFVMPKLEGDVLRGDWLLRFSAEQRHSIARQAMRGLAGVHRVAWREKCQYLGDFWGFEFDVTRWDRFYERAAEPQMLALQPTVREKLLASIPHDAHIGVYHGDFQWANTLISEDARLVAIIDWELCGIGATLNDVGWICAFNEPRAWAHEGAAGGGLMPNAEALEAMYLEAWGEPLEDLSWFKALALYKFSIITGFNLMLHRRGKRDDPHWEEMVPSMKSNMEFALQLLGG